MRIIKFIPPWVLSVVIACFIVAASAFLVPNFSAPQDGRIAPDNIRVFNTDENAQMRRPTVNDPEIYLDKQFLVGQTLPRQFSYTFIPGETADELAIFAPMLDGSSRISVNGAPHAGSQSEPYSIFGFWSAYVFSAIDKSYLHPGSNRVDIIVPLDAERNGLRSLYVGKAPQVEAVQKRYVGWLETLRKAAVVNGLIGLICAGLGIVLGGHRVTMLGGLLLAINILIQSADIFHLNVFALPVISPSIILASAVLMYAGMRTGNIRNSALINGGVFAAVIGSFCGFSLALLPVYIEHHIVVASLCVLTTFPILFAGLPLILASDIVTFRGNLRLAEENARHKDMIITDQQDALRREIEQKAVLEERQRFTRDMHDGIGGQLLSLLVRVRSGRVGMEGIESEIQSGINDLRLVVDSLDHVGDDLSSALVTFQSRARAQLDAEKIALHWSQNLNIDADMFGTRRVLNLYRFLQEAISNVLRHANASNVRVDIFSDETTGSLILVIEDDGKGLPDPDVTGAGKGLKNMYSRAKKIGGTLNFAAPKDGRGTRIELNIPLKLPS